MPEFARRVHCHGAAFPAEIQVHAARACCPTWRIVAIFVEHRRARDIARHSATRSRRSSCVETRAIIGHRKLEHHTARASLDANRAALFGRRYRVFHRVFDQWLQQEARYQRLERAFFYGELEPQALTEPESFGRQVKVHRLDFLAQRHLLHRVLMRIAQEPDRRMTVWFAVRFSLSRISVEIAFRVLKRAA